MAKQAHDLKTAELPGMPEPKRRGRPLIGHKPMTAAERKARSRKLAFDRGLKELQLTVPVTLSCSVDISTRGKLNKLARNRDLTVGQLIDELVGAL